MRLRRRPSSRFTAAASDDGGNTPDVARRLTVGAELQPGGGADVRVWAPACRRVDLMAGPRALAMERGPDGHFHAFYPDAPAGERSSFPPDGDCRRPDPP